MPESHPAALLDKARQWVLDLFNDHADHRLVWHTFSRTNELISLIARLARDEKLTREEYITLYLAGWFAYPGWLFDPNAPEKINHRLAEQFMRAESQDELIIQQVQQLIPLANLQGQPASRTETILWDAALALHFGEDYRNSQSLRRRETENLQDGHAIPAEVWQHQELEQMSAVRYLTASGKAHFEPLLLDHIRSLQRKESRRTQRVTEELPARVNTNSAIQTYFRTSFHNHIHLSAIADRKAQMLISVNAILISVLITVLSYSNIAETRPPLLIPVTLFMVCGLGSLIFSVLSARPRVTRLPVRDLEPDLRWRHLLFFGHYTQLDADQYVDEMMGLQSQGEDLCRAMHLDIYHLGCVLDRKYRLVSIAYALFMAGFIGAVSSFLALELLGY